MQHLGTYIEEKSAIAAVRAATVAAMEAAYALAEPSAGLENPSAKVWRRAVPPGVNPPYGWIPAISDGRYLLLSDFGTLAKRARVSVQHVSGRLDQIESMMARMNARMTAQAVSATGFVVIDIGKDGDDVVREDPEVQSSLFLGDQTWVFLLRPTAA